MTDRIDDALRWLTGEFSAARDEFRRQHREGGDMLLTGIVSAGYAHERDGRCSVSDAGRARMADMEAT